MEQEAVDAVSSRLGKKGRRARNRLILRRYSIDRFSMLGEEDTSITASFHREDNQEKDDIR